LMMTFVGQLKAQTFCENGIYYSVYDYDQAVVIQSPADYYSGDITIPSTVTTMVAFYGSEYEQTFNVVGIDYNAFRDCVGLTHVTLPSTLLWIGDNAFYGCSSLDEIVFPASLTMIGSSAFGYCTKIKSIELPSSVEEIGWNAFYCCTGLASATLPQSVTELNGTFFGCSALASITIPASVMYLDGTFTGCKALTSIEIPESVVSIGSRTFEGCTALQSAMLPSSLTYVGEQAFMNCDNLQSIVCRAVTPPSMYTYNSEAFDYLTYNSSNLYVPNASIPQYKSTDWWNLFKHIMGMIYLNYPSLSLTPGQTFQLNAQLAPGFAAADQITWRSDNTTVATVSSTGLVTALAAGTALVYATVDQEEVSCEVVVTSGGSTPGDVNGDGEVSVADVNSLISAILGGRIPDEAAQYYDINGDGEIGVADVNLLIHMILNG